MIVTKLWDAACVQLQDAVHGTTMSVLENWLGFGP